MSTTINKIKDLNGNDVISKYAERDSKGRKISYEIDKLSENVYTKSESNTLLGAKENTSNKTTTINENSTDTEYPSAKAVYNFINPPKTYGVRFYGTNTSGTRLYDAVGLRANVGYENEEPINDFDFAEIYKDMQPVELNALDSNGYALLDSNGNPVKNKYVRIPNFYFKFSEGTDTTGEYQEFAISTYHRSGFEKYFPVECEYVYVGAYYTTPITNNTSYYGSVSGENPKVNVSQYGINSNMSYVYVNGSLIQPNSSESLSVYTAIGVLFMIEFATRDCQSIMYGIGGESWTNALTLNSGRTNVDSVIVGTGKSESNAQVGDYISIYGLIGNASGWTELQVTARDTSIANQITYSVDKTISFPSSGTCLVMKACGSKVGHTDNLLSSSGFEKTRTYSLNNNIRHFRYRYIEDVYGNLWNICSDYAYKIVYDNGTWTRTLMYRGNGSKTDCSAWTNYTDTAFPQSNGYVKKLSYKNGAMYPKEVGGSASTYYADYHYLDSPTSSQYRTILCGGGGNYGSHDGFWYFSCAYTFGTNGYYSALRSFFFC